MKEALLYQNIDKGRVRCILCNHYCILTDGQTGLCGVRKNIGGVLYALSYENIIAKNIDPIEKKPLYHFLPGSRTFSIAAPGCNFHCNFCQNWQISQIKENRVLISEDSPVFSPNDLCNDVSLTSCRSVAFTYTEPTVFYEVINDISSSLSGNDLRFVMVSNGYMSNECLEGLNKYISAYNIDLKSFSEKFYKKNCGAKLQPVLDNIVSISNNNNWLEITTLIIPGENDCPEELDRIAAFIAGLNKNIPWHVSRFFPSYRFQRHQVTDSAILKIALETGKKHGLRYVYAGNTPEENSTDCPECGFKVISRNGFKVTRQLITESNSCPRCNAEIAGIWK